MTARRAVRNALAASGQLRRVFAAIAFPVAIAGAIVVAIGVTACADSSGDPAHPAKLIGRWVRLRDDHSWGDTILFGADGKLHGSAGYPVPASLTWSVKRDSTGTEQYCATEGPQGFCRNYHISGDTLEMIGGAHGNTVFRRVP